MLVLATALLNFVGTVSPCRAQSTAQAGIPARSPLPALTKALAGKWKLDVHFEADSSAGTKDIQGAGEELWSAGPGGITLLEQEHIPMPLGDAFLLGVIWWNSARNQLAGMECNSYLPNTCDTKGSLADITISWDGRKFQIDEMETHDGHHTVWHEYWTDITADSFTQTGDVTGPDGLTTHLMTIHGKRVQALESIGTDATRAS